MQITGPIFDSITSHPVMAPKVKTVVRGQDPRRFLNNSVPGQWFSNHLEEAKACTGWQFVATRAIAKMCSMAETTAHRVGDLQRERQRTLKSIKKDRDELSLGIDADHDFDLACRIDKKQRKVKRIEREIADREAYQKEIATTAMGGEDKKRHPISNSHPLKKLLRRPNPEWSMQTFLFQYGQQLSLTGQCLLWRVCDANGRVRELYIIPTGLVTPQLPSAKFPAGSWRLRPGMVWPSGADMWWAPGQLGMAFVAGTEFDARDVKRVAWPHPLYLSDSLSPLSAGSMWVDLSNEMDRSSWYRFQNSENPGIMFKQDGSIVQPGSDDEVRFREDLRADAAGTPNTGKHLIVPPGYEPQLRAATSTEMDYVGSRPQIREMNFALHQLSEIAAGVIDAGSFGAFQVAMKQTTEMCIQPMLDLLGGELTEFLGRSFPGEYEIGFSGKSISDPQELEQRLKTDIQAGNVLTVKEYRALRGLQPFGDERDDAFVGAGGQQQQAGAGANPFADLDGSAGGKEDLGDNAPSGFDTGNRRPELDAPPGRQDMNGKRLALNGVH